MKTPRLHHLVSSTAYLAAAGETRSKFPHGLLLTVPMQTAVSLLNQHI